MKTLLTLVFSIFYFTIFAQSKQSTTNVKIDNITKSILYFNGKVVIGTVVLDQLPNPKLTLAPIQLTLDSTGYTTIFTFSNPNHLDINDLNLVLTFDKPIISVDFAGGIGHFVRYGYNPDKTEFHYSAQKWESQTIIKLTIKSKERVKINIKGLDFVFAQ